MELLRKGTKGFAEHLDAAAMDGDFARLGGEDLASDADDIADIVGLEISIALLAHVVTADVDLDIALCITDGSKACLAHDAL